MNYRISREPDPARMASHNFETWTKVRSAYRNFGFQPMSHEFLVRVCKDHRSGDTSKPTPGDFIRYCVRMGWLEEVD